MTINHRGVVLPVVLLTLLVLAALAAGALLAARLRWQSGENAMHSLQARSLAGSEVERIIATWDPLRADSLPIGAAIPLPGSSVAGGAVSDSLLRLGQGLFLVRSVGVRSTADGGVLARDAIARLARLVAPGVPDSAAVFAAGPVSVSGLARIDGTDQVPAGWVGECSAVASGGTGVIAHPAAPVIAACGGGPCITGAPPIGTDTALTPVALTQLGPITLAELALVADHRVGGLPGAIGPQVAAGVCLVWDSLNWGDATNHSTPCGGFFPIADAAPFTRLSSGQGQGLLLAAGPLTLEGDLAFTGVVIASGPLAIRGGARVTGVVLARDSVTLSDSAVVARSRCAVDRASRGAARPLLTVDRGWFRWK